MWKQTDEGVGRPQSVSSVFWSATLTKNKPSAWNCKTFDHTITKVTGFNRPKPAFMNMSQHQAAPLQSYLSLFGSLTLQQTNLSVHHYVLYFPVRLFSFWIWNPRRASRGRLKTTDAITGDVFRGRSAGSDVWHILVDEMFKKKNSNRCTGCAFLQMENVSVTVSLHNKSKLNYFHIVSGLTQHNTSWNK